ncbi:MAG: hypothetical protein EPN74_02065 [Rhodanobacter sp.]|nr:MAG: hypothetical protein EPN74_02065 [Rhodanobacter sp.]
MSKTPVIEGHIGVPLVLTGRIAVFMRMGGTAAHARVFGSLRAIFPKPLQRSHPMETKELVAAILLHTASNLMDEKSIAWPKPDLKRSRGNPS